MLAAPLIAAAIAVLAAGLLPVLYLDNIPFRISNILKGQQPHPRHLSHCKLTDDRAAMVKDYLGCRRNVVDCKGNVRESRSVRMDWRVLRHGIILKDLEDRSIVAVARKAEVHPEDMCTAEPGSLVDPFTRQIPLRRDGHASEYFPVESREPLPVFRDQIRMGVFHRQVGPFLTFLAGSCGRCG